MDSIVVQERLVSAFTVWGGAYGAVSHYAEERGVCRQWIYREAQWVTDTLAGTDPQAERARLQARVQELEQEQTILHQRLAHAVVLDADKQAEFASVGQAAGVSLPTCQLLLDVLIPGQVPGVATLGRRTQAAGAKAGRLLQVLDEWVQPRVREATADEIYVSEPVLMVVEPESLCWVSGRLSAEVSGAAWSQEFGRLPHLEQVTRDGGTGLAKGVALVNEQRQQMGQPLLVDQGDHWHGLRGGSVGLRQAQRRALTTFTAAEEAEQHQRNCQRQGQDARGASVRSRLAWKRAEQAMDHWIELERVWQPTKEALPLFTPDGKLNTRARAEAVLAETLPQLPDGAFGKTKRALQKPEMLNYLDRVQQQLAALPFPEEVKQAAVQHEGLRRRPELLQGEGQRAAALRGVLLAGAVILSRAGPAGAQAVAAVQDICRRAYRASSLVECINSVLRMQQARHRKMTQGLLDLKRLYWNCHRFRTGRRRDTTPYQRLGVPWPEGLRWWEVLKLTPEQLRDRLSTAEKAA
jgi:hypothetical protein